MSRKLKASRVRVIGGGLAGVEAAYHLASRGIEVDLLEMRPSTMTDAHKTLLLAELVCSNSFKGDDPNTAHGLLKKEMRTLNSVVLKVADGTRVPAGKALAVDRDAFARDITQLIESERSINLIREEVKGIDTDIPTIIATGPLTSGGLTKDITRLTGSGGLYFYDAISPIVDADSIAMGHVFFGSRWSPQSKDYLNCPMTEEQYDAFIDALLAADKVKPHTFEKKELFEGCLPIEEIASRGRNSLAFGPMRPVGFVDPKTGNRPFAIVQLRKENLKGDAYNMVGFQTRLTYPAQQRVFQMIPGLASSGFLRFGSVHRNTFIDAPRILRKDLSIIRHPGVKLAGQITGVEGYMESAATGIIAGLAMSAYLKDIPFYPLPPSTAIGALIHYITDPVEKSFQPMNINFGIMETPHVAKGMRKKAVLEKAEHTFGKWVDSLIQSGLQ
ncbi:MAG: methylenetetrahydrofolate--tRNA-(uracil(54)-C(5))-methyltransferase (FADH(2)-oxidizing) TrmFO [Thermodesulfobacteriota bacterium]|nr:methylenetetrahydrofolate--tRNA-(uracil(54)-C(5))-methyltransferase (FADH(2)-oxidizing) TrmFO [Thermodesulfobacteriota bacterium]